MDLVMARMLGAVLPTASDVNLAGAWAKFWGSFQGAWGSLSTMMSIIGLLLVLFAIGKWIWAKRKGGGGASGGMIWSLVIGMILLAPNALIPVTLKIIDFVANGVVSVIGTFA